LKIEIRDEKIERDREGYEFMTVKYQSIPGTDCNVMKHAYEADDHEAQ